MLLIVYFYWQPTIMCVFFAQKYSDDTYTSPDIDVIQILMGEAGRQDFVFQGSNDVHNSMLTLSWCRHFFAFWLMKRVHHRVRDCVRRRPESSNTWIYLHSSSRAAICAENVYICEGYHEQLNYIRTTTEVALTPKETKSIIRSICTHLTTAHQTGIRNATLYCGHGLVCRRECAPQ